jgi:lipopolysaccharide O-acetyltransferase
MDLLDKALKKAVSYYTKRRERDTLVKLGIDKNDNTKVAYPCILGHPELIKIGKETQILSDSRMQVFPGFAKMDPQIYIGERCFFGFRLCILAGANIIIGNDVLVASDVTIASENHGINPESNKTYMKQDLETAPVLIGNNCWIGDKVIILPGVKIGDGCVVGAGAVVTKDIPSYSIAVGNPAHIIKRYDFTQHEWVRSS